MPKTAPKRLDREPAEWAKIHRLSGGAMLLAEQRALNRLADAARRATAQMVDAADMFGVADTTPPALLRAIRHEAEALRSAISRLVLAARGDARSVALQRLAAELRQVTKALAAEGLDVVLDTPPMSDAAEDGARADAAASSFVAAWSVAITSTILAWADDQAGRVTTAIRAAAAAQDYRLSRIATTEVATAYNDEHDEGVGWVIEQQRGASWLAALFKRWDATLDRSTCSVCHGHDGEIVLAGLAFDGDDEPAEVHANCRCQDALILLPAYLPAGAATGSYTEDADDDN